MACKFPVAVKAKLMLTAKHYLICFTLLYTRCHIMNLALWLQYINKFTYLFTDLLTHELTVR